jgi:ATP-dependent DNA helicase PIF1
MSSASDEQKTTLELFAHGQNAIILGPGGTGKTYIIRKINEYCKKKNIKMSIAAMTGKAASIIDGARTLHSLLGLRLGKRTVEEYVTEIEGNKWKLSNWKRIKILVIDEISMLGMSLFDKIDKIARIIRKCEKPFGGIQVIGSGDFLQLPPIKDEYCFKSEGFEQLFPKEHQIQYKHNFRQDGSELKIALNEIRIGKPSDKTIDLLAERLTHSWRDDDLHTEPLHIFPLKRDVNKWNKSKMSELDSPEVESKYKWKSPKFWSVAKNEFMLADLLKTLPIEQELVMKIGASVMYTVNNPLIGKHNGSTGEIIEFEDNGDPIVKFSNGDVYTIVEHSWETHDGLGVITQYPIIIAWAVTVHKVQGSELDCAQLDIGENIFEYNQIYVALSRIRTLKGIYLSAFDPGSIMAHPEALDFYGYHDD